MQKTPTLRALFIAAAFAGSALAGSHAFAGNGHGNGGGNGNGKHEDKAEKHEEKAEKHAMKEAKHGKAEKHMDRVDVKPGTYFTDEHRTFARTYYSDQYGRARNCPPGLAKKNNGCMPPGQARKLMAGQPIPAGVTYYQIPQPVLVRLPPPPAPGYRYVRVGNDIVLVSPQSRMVIDVISGLLG